MGIMKHFTFSEAVGNVSYIKVTFTGLDNFQVVLAWMNIFLEFCFLPVISDYFFHDLCLLTFFAQNNLPFAFVQNGQAKFLDSLD
jgi:hypothetical protein